MSGLEAVALVLSITSMTTSCVEAHRIATTAARGLREDDEELLSDFKGYKIAADIEEKKLSWEESGRRSRSGHGWTRHESARLHKGFTVTGDSDNYGGLWMDNLALDKPVDRCANPINSCAMWSKIRPFFGVAKAVDSQSRVLLDNSGKHSDRWPQDVRRHRLCTALVIRLIGAIFLLYPMCMLIMSNFSMMHSPPSGLNKWRSDGLKGTVVAGMPPSFMLQPSQHTFFAASMIWTFMEWAYYQSNKHDRHQKTILGVAILIGLIPALTREAGLLTVLICTVPWAMHLGLVCSDILHGIKRNYTLGNSLRDKKHRDQPVQ